jgi:hypothetical protein
MLSAVIMTNVIFYIHIIGVPDPSKSVLLHQPVTKHHSDETDANKTPNKVLWRVTGTDYGQAQELGTWSCR